MGGVVNDQLLFRFSICGSVPEIFAIKVGGCIKSTEIFACFDPRFFWGGGPPEFLDLDYKIQTVSDHVAKFQGDRPRDLGERVAK